MVALFCVTWAGAARAVELRMGDASVAPGESTTVAVTLTNPRQAVRGLQFTLALRSPALHLEGIEATGRARGLLADAHQDEDGDVRVLLATLGEEVVDAGDGAVLELRFTVASEAAGGEIALSPDDLRVAGADGVLAADAGSGTLTVNGTGTKASGGGCSIAVGSPSRSKRAGLPLALVWLGGALLLMLRGRRAVSTRAHRPRRSARLLAGTLLVAGSLLATGSAPARGQQTALRLGNVSMQPGQTRVAVPVFLDNPVAVRGLQFEVRNLPAEVRLTQAAPRVETSARTSGLSVDAAEVADGVRVVLFATGGATIAPGTGPILTLYFDDTGRACTPGADSELRFVDSRISDANLNRLSHDTSSGLVRCGCGGDLDGNGDVDVFDLLFVVDVILHRVSPTAAQAGAADVEADGEIDIFDILGIADIILGRRAECAPPVEPGKIQIQISRVAGVPGSTVDVTVSLAAHGARVAGIQNDIIFDPSLVDLARASRCKINPAIGDRLLACDDDPQTAPCKRLNRTLANCPGAAGCPAGSDGMRRFRGILLSTANVNQIPDGPLYTCTFDVLAGATGTAILRNLHLGASDASGSALEITGSDGAVLIGGAPPGPSATPTLFLPPTPTWTPRDNPTPTASAVQIKVGDANGAAGSALAVTVSFDNAGQPVSGLQNDLIFDPALIDLDRARDCRINPQLGDRLPACDDAPQTAPCKFLQVNLADCPAAAGCPAGSSGLRRFRGIVLSLANVNLIPSGPLYTCTFHAPAGASGTGTLLNLNASGSTSSGGNVEIVARSGAVTIEGGAQALCGNRRLEPGEQCDDGGWCMGGDNPSTVACTRAADCPGDTGPCRPAGGDGCAQNCTTEVLAGCKFGCVDTNNNGICGVDAGDTDDLDSGAIVQTPLFPIDLTFQGREQLLSGHARDEAVPTTDLDLTFNPLDVPLTLPIVAAGRDKGLDVDPVMVPGLVCACVRAVDTGEFGPGNGGSGRLACGQSGLAEADYQYVVDHNTNDIDPNCVNGTLEDGSVKEPHGGVCNGIGFPNFTGGGPRNSAVVIAISSISLIPDGGLCLPNCGIEDNGPDCFPCTADDINRSEPNTLATTTGTATATIEDGSNIPGTTFGITKTGVPVDCDSVLAQLADSAGPKVDLAGAALVATFATVDAASIGDNATAATFACIP